MPTYRLREAAGLINRADVIYVMVPYGEADNAYCWIGVSRPQAREILEDAKEESIEEIVAHEYKGELYIGDVEDFDPSQDEDEEEEEEEEREEEPDPADRLPPMG